MPELRNMRFPFLQGNPNKTMNSILGQAKSYLEDAREKEKKEGEEKEGEEKEEEKEESQKQLSKKERQRLYHLKVRICEK